MTISHYGIIINAMRLWHQYLIPYLDNKRLLGQHRECCALRGKGWGKKHSVVDYVFTYDRAHLYQYHLLIIHEMVARKYNVSPEWYNRLYRGTKLPPDTLENAGTFISINNDEIIYKEHNDQYLLECLRNLQSKHTELINGNSIEHMLVQLSLKGIS